MGKTKTKYGFPVWSWLGYPYWECPLIFIRGKQQAGMQKVLGQLLFIPFWLWVYVSAIPFKTDGFAIGFGTKCFLPCAHRGELDIYRNNISAIRCHGLKLKNYKIKNNRKNPRNFTSMNIYVGEGLVGLLLKVCVGKVRPVIDDFVSFLFC